MTPSGRGTTRGKLVADLVAKGFGRSAGVILRAWPGLSEEESAKAFWPVLMFLLSTLSAAHEIQEAANRSRPLATVQKSFFMVTSSFSIILPAKRAADFLSRFQGFPVLENACRASAPFQYSPWPKAGIPSGAGTPSPGLPEDRASSAAPCPCAGSSRRGSPAHPSTRRT